MLRPDKIHISATSSGIDKCEVATIDVTIGNTKCLAICIRKEVQGMQRTYKMKSLYDNVNLTKV